MNFCQMNMSLIFLWELTLKHKEEEKMVCSLWNINKQIPFSSGLKNICPDSLFKATWAKVCSCLTISTEDQEEQMKTL